MTHELILTSVANGLEKDSRGFCVVACDNNIPASLVKRLNTISSYRHLFPPDSLEAKHLPIAYSHYIVHALDTTWSVLSRVAPLGWDFEHNPNHLAHHIALTEHEYCTEGPAWLLGLAGFHLTEWYTPPVRFTIGRSIPSLLAPAPLSRRQRIARERHWLDDAKMSPRTPPTETRETLAKRRKENNSQMLIQMPPSCPCPLWKEITGDAAWGGVLAETVLTGQHAAIIYETGTNILPLFVEALSLLSREHLWRATFTTFYAGLPEHIICQWKGTVAGSKEAKMLSQDTDILLIDLTKPLGTAPEGLYADYARYGNDNLLAEHKSGSNFMEGPDFDTKTYHVKGSEDEDKNSTPAYPLPSNAPEEASEEISETPDDDDQLEWREDEDVAPTPFIRKERIPVPKPEIIIQTDSKKSKGVFSSFLNMKSNTQFYILYAVTFVLVCFLFVLVLDRYFNYGLLFNQKSESAVKKSDHKKSTGEQTTAESDKEKKVKQGLAAEENKKRESEKQKNAQRQQHLAQIEKKRNNVEKLIATQKAKVNSAMDDFKMPPFLPLIPPSLERASPEEANIIPPETPQVFPEFAPLYPVGAALKISFIPLLTLPKITIVTEKQKFYLEDDKDETENIAADDALEGTPEEERIPDISRFEWLVSSINEDNEQKTPLFLIKLTADGLSIEWLRDGLTPQNFYNTLWTSLAFLKCSVDGGEKQDIRKQVSRKQDGEGPEEEQEAEEPEQEEYSKSVQLFKPFETEPVYLNKVFDGGDKTEFTVSTSFAEEPWKTLFTVSNMPPFALVLETKMLPNPDPADEKKTGIKSFKFDEETLPFRFFVEIRTDVESKKGTGNKELYSPIDVPLEGIAGPDKIVWSDRCKDRIVQLQEEAEESSKTSKENEKELDAVKQQILSGVSNLPKEAAAELRKKRNELQQSITDSKTRSSEIKSIVEKIPEAQKRIFANADLRIEYSLIMKRADAADGDDSSALELLLVRTVIDNTDAMKAETDTDTMNEESKKKPASTETETESETSNMETKTELGTEPQKTSKDE
ncbi:MAG: hypothetical protein FWE67_04065 [Planctomycetaceae bacterium]|nr:hypothetical protein [Planctomycetaceae bacterium]